MTGCRCRPRDIHPCRHCRAIRDRLAAQYPACILCGELCVAGQRDALGRTVHFGCQPSLPPEERDPRLAEYPTSFGRRVPGREGATR